MTAVGITCRRTMAMVRSLYSTTLAAGLFLVAAGFLFAFALESAEGGGLPLAAVWAASVSPALPVLASILGMDVWSEERRSGRIDALLTAPVRERDYTFGKFLGLWATTMGIVAVFFLSSMSFVAAFAPSLLAGRLVLAFMPAFLILAIQSALWCAVALASSAAFRHSAAAALTSIALTCAIPRGIWTALMAWAPQGGLSFGEMPLDAHVIDFSCGQVSSATLLAYITLTFFALFVSSKFTAALRLVGRGSRPLKWSTGVALALATALAGASIALFFRLNTTIDLPFDGRNKPRFSARTRTILSEAHGEISVTVFLSRKDARFRPVGHFLRALSREAEAVGGVRVAVRYVDPNWDIGAAQRLVRSGAREDSLVFERGRRQAVIPLSDGYGERICASAIQRVAMPPQRRNIYWTSGHGESSFEVYGTWGMSDIARDLSRDGYRNLEIDLADGAGVPADCALVVVAGAKSDFSRTETGRLDTYLRKGGRLLVLLSSADEGGVATMLSSWGLRPAAAALAGTRTLSGTDVIVSDFSDHPVADPLKGSQIVLERPVSFTPSAAADSTGAGVDRIEYSDLASVNSVCVAAASERGAGTGDDLAIRPTRIIAIGDAAFAMNGQLAANANANRDFFLNCVSYLAGTDMMAESGAEANQFVSGMDRRARVRFIVYSAVVFPGIAFVIMFSLVAAARRRG